MLNKFEDSNSIYDYIIIGTGPAGSVMAKILSDNRMNSILVLETGDNNIHEVPIQTSSTETWRFFPQYFWQGSSVAQTHVNQRLFHWTTGRTLGGGSAINGGKYVRPTTDVLNKWASHTGPIWSPEQATAYFIQLENYHGQTHHPEYRGYNGRLHIRQTPEVVPPLTDKLIAAMEQATGYPAILDYNDPTTPIGPFHRWQLYQQPNGQRESAATAFLSSDIMTPEGFGVNGRNLRVLFKTNALHIIMNGNREAVGVEFLKSGYCLKAYARKKVILSAGINSSQLLMLSGIGSAKMLGSASCPIVLDNPNVGCNLLTHLLYKATFSLNLNDLPAVLEDPNALYNGGAFLPMPYTNAHEQRGVELVGSVVNNQLELLITYLLPESRGAITLQNNDPLKIVLADYNLLSDPRDMEASKHIFRSYVLGIAERLALIDPAYKLLSPSVDIINDDTQLENYLRSNVEITYDEQSFNRMASLKEEGVVDPYGNVYGVSHLVVCDTSIIPNTIDANNSASAFLVGYTLAKQILRTETLPSPYPYPFYPSIYRYYGY